MRKLVESRPIQEVMTTSPLTVAPETSISTLQSQFETHDFNAFPVVDERGLLRGIVTKLDFLRIFRPGRRPGISGLWATVWAERVEDIMRRGVIVVSPEDSVLSAIDLMVENQHRSLPVIERQPEGLRLVGIVTRKDLLRCLIIEDTSVP